jgi:uncharacterized protein YprB with RNaseH-like and TPR domain
MIQNTFCHINGVGQKIETRLWDSGIHSWEDFFTAPTLPVSRAKAALIRGELTESRKNLRSGRIDYFFRRLPSNQQWRLFTPGVSRIAYIDIETTGLSRQYNAITTIALYDGTKISHYVTGRNLDHFPDDIRGYDLLVTYNGKSFDIPFIEGFFGIQMPRAHIDLRHVFHGLGIKGGLKGCEKQFGIDRRGLEGVDGYVAVLLWQEFERTRDPHVLETLLAYNIEDAVNLEYLMHTAYNLKLAHTPFAPALSLAVPDRPEIPFAPAPAIIGRIVEKRHAAGFDWQG